ncbi:MAG: aldo/keto reductase [Proteobacteria bacterium]|nr:aldo/keto reductase [Pseudomonadota bacterium]
MRKRSLGRTGYRVAELGFGAWSCDGEPLRDVDPRETQRTLYQALDLGIDFVATAMAHGDGTGEKLIGEVIRDLRARDWAVVATELAPLAGRRPDDSESDILERFPPGYVVESVEQSLRALRAEALCIAQLHGWTDAWLSSMGWPELRHVMQRLIQEGKVLHWGVSIPAGTPAPATQLGAAGESGSTGQKSWQGIQSEALADPSGRAAGYSTGESMSIARTLSDRDPAPDSQSPSVDDLADQVGWTVRPGSLLWTPGQEAETNALSSQLEPGQMESDQPDIAPIEHLSVFGEPIIEIAQVVYNIQDPQRGDTVFARARDSGVGILVSNPFGQATPVERVEALLELYADHVGSWPELALRFCLSHPDAGVVVADMQRPEHLRENLAFAERGPLPAELIDQLGEQSGDSDH